MDAIVDRTHPAGPREPEWPPADVIVGNPPFLGGKRLKTELGEEYVEAMFEVWDGRVQRTADLCCYWHEKARRMVHASRVKRAGLLATQAIRGGASRETLARIKESGDIFFAESEPQVGFGWRLCPASRWLGSTMEPRRTTMPRRARPVEGINVESHDRPPPGDAGEVRLR